MFFQDTKRRSFIVISTEVLLLLLPLLLLGLFREAQFSIGGSLIIRLARRQTRYREYYKDPREKMLHVAFSHLSPSLHNERFIILKIKA